MRAAGLPPPVLGVHRIASPSFLHVLSTQHLPHMGRDLAPGRLGPRAAVPAPHALSTQDHGKQTIRLRIDRVLSYHGWPFSQIDKIGEPLRFRAIGESDGPKSGPGSLSIGLDSVMASSRAISRFAARTVGPARLAALAFAGAVAVTSAATAGSTSVALVVGVTGNPPDVALMDYLRAGQIIRLGPRQGVVLTYMSSCLRETITGPGAVTVGTDRSEVQSGEIKRTGGQCDLDKATFPNAHGEFGARTFRGPHPPVFNGEGSYAR
jgi:hypothetical protein